MAFQIKSRSSGASDPTLLFPVKLDSTKKFLVDQNGNPCFACGDSPQILIEQLNKSDIEIYLSDRSQRGMNLLWMIVADNAFSNNHPNNFNGDAPFSGADFTNFNSAYWNYVDYVMQRALANGQTVLLMPLFVGLTGSDGYLTSLTGSSDAVITAYGTFLGNRYKGFLNLIWLLGGDADPNDAAAYGKLDKLAVAIKAADPGHLMTLEASRFIEVANGGGSAPNGGYSSVDAHAIAYGSTKSWLDLNWVYQTLATVTSGSQRCYPQGLPCLLGEDWYELEHSTTALQLRTEAYAAVLGGCTLGRLFGNGIIWPFNSTGFAGNLGTSPTWQSQLGAAGSLGQQYMGRLFRSRSHQLLVPDISNVVMTTGSASGSICARTSDGKTIIAYLPTSQTVTVDMSKITDAGSLANCNWYNPATGAVTPIGNIANSGTHNFTSPDSSDWVLVIDSAAAALRTPGT